MTMYDDPLSQKIIAWLKTHYLTQVMAIKDSKDTVSFYRSVEPLFLSSLKQDNCWTKEDKEQLVEDNVLTTEFNHITADGYHYFIRLIGLAK